MEDPRATTLQALSTFIDKQRALLTRTHADISRLNELRSRAVNYPEEFESDLPEKLNDSSFKLSELEEAATSAPEDIEWSLFSKHDPAPFEVLAEQSKLQQPPASKPSLSDSQSHIQEARSRILDPVFSSYNLSFNPVLETEDEDEMKDQQPVDTAALKKAKEREKIKELKKHRIMPSSLTFIPSGHRTRGPGGVFIRMDVVDESMDVDISLDTESSSKTNQFSASLTSESGARSVSPSSGRTSIPPQQIPCTPPTTPNESPSIVKLATCTKTSRSKSSSVKVGVLPSPLTLRRHRTRTISCTNDVNVHDSAFPPTPDSLPFDTELDAEDSPRKEDDIHQVLGKRLRPKSETYKQAWSSSEQQLLEALLEEIPEGEKNRWKKISKAMNGRRTPRQVASRVQKYFEKLKKFGIK